MSHASSRLALVASWCCLVLPMATQAQSAPQASNVCVRIVYPRHPDALLDEALIRTRGELSAAGFCVTMAPAGDDLQAWQAADHHFGALKFHRDKHLVTSTAYARLLEDPVVQASDTRVQRIDAEVVAVRAVEGLRAAMLQYAARAHAEHIEMPAIIQRFTRAGAPAQRMVEVPTLAEVPPTYDDADDAQAFVWQAWLGASVAVDLAAPAQSWGGRVALLAGGRHWLAGVGIEHTWSAPPLLDTSGEISFRRGSIMLLAQRRQALSAAAETFLRLGGGLARYAFDAVATPPFVAHDALHWSVVLSAELGVSYWPNPYWGVFASVGAAAALNAPSLRLAEHTLGDLDRPMLTASLGIVLGRR